MSRRLAVVLAAAALVVGGCSGDPAVEATPTPTRSPVPAEQLGPELTADADPGEAAGFALAIPDGIVLTTTTGVPLGHLPGWTLDRAGSDRLSAPVLEGPDGTRRVVTGDGLLPETGRLPAAGRHRIVVGPNATRVLGADGATLTRLRGDRDHLWVSALGDVVTVIDGDAYDVAAEEPADVPVGCRVADRHPEQGPLLVCDGGDRLAGDTDVAAPDDRRFAWVTVGTTGDEILATTASACGRRQAMLGSRSSGEVADLTVDGAAVASEALFVRSSGDAWVALFDVACEGDVAAMGGVYSRSAADGTLERLGESWPGLDAAAIWVR